MTNYPPTPAFDFPLPLPRGPPGLTHDLRKLSINNTGSNNTALRSSAIQSPNFVSKFASNNSTSRQSPSSRPSAVSITSPNTMHAPLAGLSKQDHRGYDGLPEDREEGELSDADDLEGSHTKRRNNRSEGKQRDRGDKNQEGRGFVSHSMRTNSEASNHSPIPRSKTWNEPYHGESTSHTLQGLPADRKEPFDISSVAPLGGGQHDRRFNQLNQSKGTGNEKCRAGLFGGSFQDHKLPGSGTIASLPSGPKNLSLFHTASEGTHLCNSPVHLSTPYSPLQTATTVVELRNEAQRAVLNMIPLRVSWRYMVDEAGIDPNVLKKVYTVIGLPVPTETCSPSPNGDIHRPQGAVAKPKLRDKSSDKIEIDKDAQAIRKQLEKDARDKERREAEAKAAELVRQREAVKEEEEKTRRLAEVEAKKEVVRRKINEMGLPGKSASPSLPLTPISSTPVVAAIARATPLPVPKPEVTRIPGLLLSQLDGPYLDSLASPDIMPEQNDTIMRDSPGPMSSSSGQPTTASTVSNMSTAAPSLERSLSHRKKRPVASDMYSEPMPTTKRKFGDHRKMPIELIIDISEEEEGGGGEEEGVEGSVDDSRTYRSTPSGTDRGFKRSTTTGNNTPPRPHPTLTAPGGGFASNGNSKLDSAKALQDKEEQIRALKHAIQKAQQKKKLATKTGSSTPTSVRTPSIGAGPSVPPPLPQMQQQQVIDVAVALSSALDITKQEAEIPRQEMEGEKQKKPFTQPQEAKVDVIKLKELQKREQLKKIDALRTEIEEIKRRKEAENIEATKMRQYAKEEKVRQLKEAENERLKKMLEKEKVLQELAKMRREEEEMEAKKEALRTELAALEKEVVKVDILGEIDKAADEVISKKKEEIKLLKKAMEEIEVDQIIMSAVSSPPESDQTSPSHELAQPVILEGPQQKGTDATDIIMEDNIEPITNRKGLVSTDQPQMPVLDKTEISVSCFPVVSALSIDISRKAMDVDRIINEREKVNGNDVYTDDVDMDASSDEEEDQEKDKGMGEEPNSEADETSGAEVDNYKEKQPELEPQTLERKISPPTATSQELVYRENVVQNHAANSSAVEEANVPIPVHEQRNQTEELMDPTKITATTAVKNVDMKHEQKNIQRQPEHVFTPYKSPLTNFKSFRYHPNFLAFCPGGYRSLTFSNRIDPIKPLCRWELSGGICSDTRCVEQHKRQIEMPDDEILVELASVAEGSTGEERDNYNSGLRQAIAAMREQGIKDFETVVAGIASYRRQFLVDETRVLRLPPSQPPQTSHHQQRGTSFSSYT